MTFSLRSISLGYLAIAGLLAILSGIAIALQADFSSVRFEVEKSTFRQTETIRGKFINGWATTVYIVMPNGCGQDPLQRQFDKGWSYPPSSGKYLCTMLEYYLPVAPAESKELTYSPDKIRHLVGADTRGTYRFVWQVAPKEHSDSKALISPAFQIVD